MRQNPRGIFRALAGLLLRISRRPSWGPRRSSRPPFPPCRIMMPQWPSNARCCARRWPRPRAIIRRPPRPWGCSAPISNACSTPSASANLTWIYPVSERIQAPGAACRVSTGSRLAPARGACAPPPTPDAPRDSTPGGTWPLPTAWRPRLAWPLLQDWTVLRPPGLPPPVGKVGRGA
jgi:hypothetical protein